MPIKWKTTEVETPEGKVKVTHWAKHKAEEIIAALRQKPAHTIGKHPIVNVHKLGKQKIAVRQFRPYATDTNQTPHELFNALKELAELKASIVETPVALIERAETPTIVTLWKENAGNLEEFIANAGHSLALKKKACIGAVKQVAQLHAAGWAHGHVKPANIVVDRLGNARLVDYALMARVAGKPAPHLDKQIFDHLGFLLYSYAEEPAPNKFSRELHEEYMRAFERHAAKRK